MAAIQFKYFKKSDTIYKVHIAQKRVVAEESKENTHTLIFQ